MGYGKFMNGGRVPAPCVCEERFMTSGQGGSRATLGRLMAATMFTAVAAPLVAAGAAAPAATPPDAPASVGEIIVTGSMIQRMDVETPSPVTVLDKDLLQVQGITNMADAVRSVSADNSGTVPEAFSNGFASGSSGVALRGLTVNSTLVLIDGLRTANYPLADDGERGFVDLNTIPFSSVQRVEVLKDGASSVYGADAIGGVVNIIMYPTYQGEEGTIELGGTQHGGGFGQRYTALLGHGDLASDKYNAYIDFEYQRDAAIRVTQRGFPYNTGDLSSIGGANLIGGQPGLFSGSVYGTVTPATMTPGDLLSGVPVPGAVSQPLRPCGPPTTQETDSSGNVYCAQNFLKYGDFQPLETRYGGLAHFTAQLSPHTQAWLMASYYVNRTLVDQGPAQINSSTPHNTNAIVLPALLSSGQLNPNDPFAATGQAALINYAFGDIPAGLTETNHVFRAVAGLKGDLAGWTYNASIDVNHASLATNQTGAIRFDQLISDINSGAYSFINPASNSAAVLSALAPPISKTSTTDLDSFDASITRPLFDLPGGALAIALGGQFRYEATNDPDLNPGSAYQGLGVAHTVGSRTVGALFAELNAPILKQLEVDVSGRYDHYSDVGGHFSPKVGVKFTPIHQLILRGTFSEGFRAPSFSESGASASEGFINYNPQASAPASFNNAHNNDAYTQQYSLAEYTVANTHIRPETSRSFTLGAVVQPVRWFSASVDYYNIHKDGVIAQSDPGAVLSAYFAGTALPVGATVIPDIADPQAPAALARPLVVQSPYVNANSLQTEGLDVDVQVRAYLPYNVKFRSELSVTDIFHYYFTASGSKNDYVGTQAPYILSSGAGTPKWRGSWTNSFTLGKATLAATVYYVSGIKETGVDATGSATACLYSGANGADFPAGCRVGRFIDVDMSGSYDVTTHVQVYADIYNLFDAKPPLDPADYAGGGANYNPTYAQAGIVGRAFKIGLRMKF